MSNIYQIAEEFRQEILRGERQAASEMVSAYGAAWKDISRRLTDLTDQIEAARKEGRDVSPAWLFRQERYNALLSQIRENVDRLSTQAGITIAGQQFEAVQKAQSDAFHLMQAGIGSAVGTVSSGFNRVPAEALTALVGTFQDGSPLRDLLDGLGADAADHAKAALIAGLARGANPKDIARDVRRGAGVALVRSLSISRTETLRSYRQASQLTYRANADIVKGWVWVAALSLRTCAACLAMHGTEHPLDEDFGSHPMCRCTPVPLTKSWEELGFDGIEETAVETEPGPDWFARQSADRQDAVLGKKAGEAYRAGKVSLPDFVAVKTSTKWGTTRQTRSLKDALAQADSRRKPDKPEKPKKAQTRSSGGAAKKSKSAPLPAAPKTAPEARQAVLDEHKQIADRRREISDQTRALYAEINAAHQNGDAAKRKRLIADVNVLNRELDALNRGAAERMRKHVYVEKPAPRREYRAGNAEICGERCGNGPPRL